MTDTPPAAPTSPGVPAASAPPRGRGVFRPRWDQHGNAQRDRRSTRPYAKHGLDRLKTAVRLLGARTVDRRTAVGKALAEWRSELIADLGGRDDISTQVAAVVELAVRNKLLLDSIDAWLLTQRSLVDNRRRALLPVVKERQALADALARYMTMLGLERRKKTVQDLNAYVAAKYGAGAQPVDGDRVPRTPVAPRRTPVVDRNGAAGGDNDGKEGEAHGP